MLSLVTVVATAASLVAVTAPSASSAVVDEGWEPPVVPNRQVVGGIPEDGEAGRREAVREREVVERRTAKSKTFELSSGGFETELFPVSGPPWFGPFCVLVPRVLLVGLGVGDAWEEIYD